MLYRNAKAKSRNGSAQAAKAFQEQGPISAHHSSLISNVSNAEILQHKLLMTIHNCEVSLNVKFLSIATFCENIS